MAVEKELKIVIGGDSSGGESALKRIGETAMGMGLEKIIEKVAAFSVDFIKDSIAVANETEKTYRQLDAVLTSTGRAADISRAEIDKIASSLANNSEFTKSSMLQMETLMLQYDKIGKDILPQASQAMIDFAARTGGDPVSSARALGMALQEPFEGLNRLRSMGIKVSEDQKKLMDSFKDTGNTAKAQELIIGMLNKQYGGAAAANVDEYDRLQKKLASTIKALQIVIGTYVMQGLEPIVKALIPILDTTTKLINGTMKLTDIIKLSDNQWRAIKATLVATGVVMTAVLLPAFIAMATTAVTTAVSVVVAMAPILAVIAVVAAAVYALMLAWDSNFLGIRDITKTIMENVKFLFSDDGIMWMKQTLDGWIKDFTAAWNGAWQGLADWLDGIVKKMKAILDGFFNWAKSMIDGLLAGIGKIMGAASKGSSGGGGSFATGGLASGTVLVGEMGPELVNLPGGSFVNQAAATRNMGGNTATNITINNPTIRSDNDITMLVRQIKKALGRENELAKLGAI